MPANRPVYSVDASQPAIVDALRQAGCTVVSLAMVGDDIPDLLVCVPPRWETWLVEVKSTKGKLRPGQSAFAKTWPGKLLVARSPIEALTGLGLAARPIATISRNFAQTGGRRG